MMTIRRLELGEGELYRRVRLAALHDSPAAFSSRYEDAITRGRQSWCDQADSSAYGSDRATFVVITDGQPVGLAALYRDDGDPTTGELMQMWIAPEMRGGRAAQDLLNHLFRWAGANRFERVKAEVITGNSRALEFYKRFGFTESTDEVRHSKTSVVLSNKVMPP